MSNLLFALASAIARAYVKLKLKPEIKNSAGKISGPAVILANHQSNMDWLITSSVLEGARVNFVVGRYQFYNPLKCKLFLSLGCIPKSQFYPDFQTVRMIKRIIRNNGIIVIFPAGQSSFSGEGTLIPFEIAKLLKSLSVPVFNIHINGAHLAFPKWDMSSVRKNRIAVSFEQLFSREDILLQSEDEIYKKVYKALYFDDYEWQRENKLAAKKNRSAKGLEHVLFKCPVCKEEFGMRAKGHVLRCRICGYTVCMDEYGFLSAQGSDTVFDTPTQWYRWQYGEVFRQIRENPQYTFTVDARLTKLRFSGKAVEIHNGRLSFSKGILELRNERTSELLFYEDVRLTPILFQHESTLWFELVSEELIYRFQPVSTGTVTKLVIMKELYYLTEKLNSARSESSRLVIDEILMSKVNLGRLESLSSQ